jgi:hypothetical protein
MVELNITKAKDLLKQFQKKISVMEFGTVKFKGHMNISRADMEILEIRLETAIDYKYYNPNEYIPDHFCNSVMETVYK